MQLLRVAGEKPQGESLVCTKCNLVQNIPFPIFGVLYKELFKEVVIHLRHLIHLSLVPFCVHKGLHVRSVVSGYFQQLLIFHHCNYE